MKTQHINESNKTQSQVSQEISNESENSRVKSQNQVDSSNQATIVSNLVLVSSTSESENPNSEADVNAFAYSEDADSDLFILDSNESNKSNVLGKEVQSNFTDIKSPVLLTLPHTIVSEEQLNGSVDNFIEGISSIHFIRAQELLDCADSLSYKLALKTVMEVERANKSNWLLTGIAAYRIWSETPSLLGGAFNTADPEEGRVNALKKFAEDCTAKGVEVKYKTLYAYVGWVRKLLEEPLQEFAGSGEKTIRFKRGVLMEKLFTLPPGLAKIAAAGSATPSKALEKLDMVTRLEADKGKAITGKEYRIAMQELRQNGNGACNNDIEQKNENNDNGDESDVVGATSGNTSTVREPVIRQTAGENLSLEGFFASQVYSEAKRMKFAPEQVKDLYVSFLQTIISSLQDMGVAK